MSTKIYDAYLYRGTIHSLMAHLAKLRAELRERFVTQAAGWWSPEDFNFLNFSDGLRKMLRSGERFCQVDGVTQLNPACSAVVYPARVGRRSGLLVQFFGVEHLDLDKLLPRRFRDFHYQDQTDHPFSRREWVRRKRTWDRVFRGARTPEQAGLTYDLVGEGAAFDLAFQVFEKLHGHRPYDQEAGKTCAACERRRAYLNKEKSPCQQNS